MQHNAAHHTELRPIGRDVAGSQQRELVPRPIKTSRMSSSSFVVELVLSRGRGASVRCNDM
jgi:hypothetical protein